jgi:hypothetical protein
MRRAIGVIVMFVVLILAATPVLARVITTVATIKGTLFSETDGACSADSADYDSFCPSGTCVCDTYEGTIRGSLVGRGTAVVTLTVDVGAKTTSSALGCVPFFGVASFSTNRESETDNATGTICTTFANAQKNYVSGGFGIESSSQGISGGWGTLSGTLNERLSPAKLTVVLRVGIPR